MRRKIDLLVIAGFDPSGGAGILLDRIVLLSYKKSGFFIPSALTLQDHFNFEFSRPLCEKEFRENLLFFFKKYSPSAVKIGQVGSEDLCSILHEFLKNKNLPVVFDPVIVSSTGGKLFNGKIDEMKKISSLAFLTTPSSLEAEIITGYKINSLEKMKRVAVKLKNYFGSKNLLLKGGDASASEMWVYDVLVSSELYIFRHKRFPFKLRGGGCIFSASLACELCDGGSLHEIIRRAQKFMRKAFENSVSVGEEKRVWSG